MVLPAVAQFSPYVMCFRGIPFIVSQEQCWFHTGILLCKYEDIVRIHILQYFLRISCSIKNCCCCFCYGYCCCSCCWWWWWWCFSYSCSGLCYFFFVCFTSFRLFFIHSRRILVPVNISDGISQINSTGETFWYWEIWLIRKQKQPVLHLY